MMNALGVQDASQVLHSGLKDLGLCLVQTQICGCEPFQDYQQALLMLLVIFANDQDVVNIHKDTIKAIQKVTQK